LSDRSDGQVILAARPAAVARGRVVDGDSKPYAHVRVAYGLVPGNEAADGFDGALQWVSTDNEGRINTRGLPIGARCDVFAIHPVGGGRSRRKSFEVKNAGRQDVGDVILHPR